MERITLGLARYVWSFFSWGADHADVFAQDWLSKMNAHRKEIWPHLEETYGKDKTLTWFHRWQIFYMACAELFAYEGGETWGVCHYLFEKPRQ